MRILRDYPLTNYGSMRLKASADHFTRVSNPDELATALDFAKTEGLPWFVLGGGTNTILPQNYPGLCIALRLRGIKPLPNKEKDGEEGSVQLKVAAGESLSHLRYFCAKNGWHGLENFALIPGSVGACPIQNVGAYGTAFDELIESVEVFDTQYQSLKEWPKKDCGFGYRTSVFRDPANSHLIVTSVTIRLKTRPNTLCLAHKDLLAKSLSIDTPRQLDSHVCALRTMKLPPVESFPNVGSFFTNPIVTADAFNTLKRTLTDLPARPIHRQSACTKDSDTTNQGAQISAAYLIDKLGWRGRRHGGIEVWPNHALVLVNWAGTNESNERDSTADDVLQMANNIRENVYSEFGVKLAIEPKIL